MSGDTIQPLARIEGWSAGAFFLAGGLFVIFAALWGAFAVTNMTSETVQNVVGPAGWTAAFVGLLGIYPKVAREASRLSQLAAGFAGLGCLGGFITAAGNLTILVGIVETLPVWFEAVQLLLLVGIIPGFLAFALAIFRGNRELGRLGLLLLSPAVIFAVNIVRVAIVGSTTPIWSPFLLGMGQAVALLAIGYTIRTVPLEPGGVSPASGPVVK